MSVTVSSKSPFGIHAAAYWAARGAYEKHRDDCRPVQDDDPLVFDYESAYEPLVSAMHAAAHKAVLTPAATTSEIFQKIEIMMTEDLHDDHRDTVRELIEALGRDAARIGGVS